MKTIFEIYTDTHPSIIDEIKKWLKENGYDGLSDDVLCGCNIDNLLLCENQDCLKSCYPAYLNKKGKLRLKKEQSDEAS